MTMKNKIEIDTSGGEILLNGEMMVGLELFHDEIDGWMLDDGSVTHIYSRKIMEAVQSAIDAENTQKK